MYLVLSLPFSSYFHNKLSQTKYSGFLAVILIVELTLAVSLYTYKDHLTGGLRKGLNQSLHNYGPSAVMQSADFDAMQENVSSKKNETDDIKYSLSFRSILLS